MPDICSSAALTVTVAAPLASFPSLGHFKSLPMAQATDGRLHHTQRHASASALVPSNALAPNAFEFSPKALTALTGQPWGLPVTSSCQRCCCQFSDSLHPLFLQHQQPTSAARSFRPRQHSTSQVLHAIQHHVHFITDFLHLSVPPSPPLSLAGRRTSLCPTRPMYSW